MWQLTRRRVRARCHVSLHFGCAHGELGNHGGAEDDSGKCLGELKSYADAAYFYVVFKVGGRRSDAMGLHCIKIHNLCPAKHPIRSTTT